MTEEWMEEARKHVSFHDSVAHAVARAFDTPGEYFSIWYDGKAMYVRLNGAAGPKGGYRVAQVKKIIDSVRIKFSDGQTEWVKG